MTNLPLKTCITVDLEALKDAHFLRYFREEDDRDAIPRLINQLLESFEESEIGATFFILGTWAKNNPSLVKLIHQSGHEVASHSMTHRHLDQLSLDDLMMEVKDSKHLLEDIIGEAVFGFRAPSWSLPRRNQRTMFFQLLLDEGYFYDSSLYGFPYYSNFEYCKIYKDLWEVSPASFSFWKVRFPCGGGAYFRLLPVFFINLLLKRNKNFNLYYLHPHDLMPSLPRVAEGFRAWLCHYYGRKKAMKLYERVIREAKGAKSVKEFLLELKADTSHRIS